MSHDFSARNALLHGALFFLICFGLGYPILNRYDPGKVPGASDAADYSNAVRSPMSIASYRPFVPALAKPFYWFALGRLKSWDPALFGLLMASSLLSAGTAVALIAIGMQTGLPYATAALGACLYLFNFSVSNLNLSGYVDSGEGFFLALVILSLLLKRWYLLPLWALPGAFSKETFAPFAVMFCLVWWYLDRPRQKINLVWIAVLAALSGAAVLLTFSSLGGIFHGAMHYSSAMVVYDRVGFFAALIRCLKAREVWYTFIWLMPLGLLRWNRLDARFKWATAAAFFVALMLGACNDSLGNVSRALFNIAGPLLSLSAASLLVDRQVKTA